MSSPRSRAFSLRRASIRCLESGAAASVERNRPIGAVIRALARSTAPNIPAAPSRIGPSPPTRWSTVISTRATTSSPPRINRPRRVSFISTHRPRRSVPRLRDQHLLQGLEVLHALAGAERDRVERIVDHVDRHAGLLAEPYIHALEQGAAAGERDA